jgi:competence protein ComEC
MNRSFNNDYRQKLKTIPMFSPAAGLVIGIFLDHRLALPIEFGLSLLGFTFLLLLRQHGFVSIGLFLGALGFGVVDHHWSRTFIDRNDLSLRLTEEAILLRVRGIVLEEPQRQTAKQSDWISLPPLAKSSTILRLHAMEQSAQWHEVGGKAWLQVDGLMETIHLGDEVEVFGWISLPPPPRNPGEFDFPDWLRTNQIRSLLHVRKTDATVVRLRASSDLLFEVQLNRIRLDAESMFARNLQGPSLNLAYGLILGETDRIDLEEWDQFARTGVIHVIAISGQHLILLTSFLWVLGRLTGFSHRALAWQIALLVLLYTLMTGARPASIRAMMVVWIGCMGIYVRRAPSAENTWFTTLFLILLLKPTDLFTPGLQFSFLSMAILIWVQPNWFPILPRKPIEVLVDQSRPAWQQWLRWAIIECYRAYRLTLLISLLLAPLMLHHQHLLPLLGILIGPPLILLGMFALLLGFAMWGLSIVGMDSLLAPALQFTLDRMLFLIRTIDQFPLTSWYQPELPLFWMLGFYLLLAIVSLFFDSQTLLLSLTFWCALLFFWPEEVIPKDELQLHFLSVGHGSCCVMQTPDGRTVLFDAGSTLGPDIARRIVAPFLWHQRCRRIDEVIVSHADLDHFNGLALLANRFPIGQISCNPTFAEKPLPAVERLLNVLQRMRIPVRKLKEGDQLDYESVHVKLLHPSGFLPEGPENLRSLVFVTEFLGHRILMTGDVEKTGIEELLRKQPESVDLLQVPHHGSGSIPHERLLSWAKPKLAIISREDGPIPEVTQKAYHTAKVPILLTSRAGCISIKFNQTGIIAQSFRSGQETVVKFGITR